MNNKTSFEILSVICLEEIGFLDWDIGLVNSVQEIWKRVSKPAAITPKFWGVNFLELNIQLLELG